MYYGKGVTLKREKFNVLQNRGDSGKGEVPCTIGKG